MAPEKSEVVKINLRLSRRLHRLLRRTAKRNNTSLQQEIVDRLEHTYNLQAQAELIQQTATATAEAFKKVMLSPRIAAGGDKDR